MMKSMKVVLPYAPRECNDLSNWDVKIFLVGWQYSGIRVIKMGYYIPSQKTWTLLLMNYH